MIVGRSGGYSAEVGDGRDTSCDRRQSQDRNREGDGPRSGVWRRRQRTQTNLSRRR